MKLKPRLGDRWAFHYDKCKRCGKNEFEHYSKGFCIKCKDKAAYEQRKGYFLTWRYCNKERIKEVTKKYLEKNKEEISKKYKDKYYKDRVMVLENYGNKCNCCGEKEPKFLCIDHVNNDGKDHRKKIRKANIYKWLRLNNFPKEGFQILCHNCNMAKGFYGECPHKIH